MKLYVINAIKNYTFEQKKNLVGAINLIFFFLIFFIFFIVCVYVLLCFIQWDFFFK